MDFFPNSLVNNWILLCQRHSKYSEIVKELGNSDCTHPYLIVRCPKKVDYCASQVLPCMYHAFWSFFPSQMTFSLQGIID